MRRAYIFLFLFTGIFIVTGCRVETVGDPNRPIKIEAHITIDIRQVKETVSSIEDMVSGKQPAKAEPDKNSKNLAPLEKTCNKTNNRDVNTVDRSLFGSIQLERRFVRNFGIFDRFNNILSVIRKNFLTGLIEYAYAQDEVQAAIESRKARYQTIKDYKRQGLIGENNKGYLIAFSEDSAVKNLVEQENKDRLIIYKSIVEQKGYPRDAISQIEDVSAQEQRDRAESGEKIQLENGEWITK
ncbi:MAG: DUF1318 domain-containing protein [Candidatus Omnitrophica bacterium]|nr:DUF1318 domain-containing protein [Candidatus Omnitrophota bacterium]